MSKDKPKPQTPTRTRINDSVGPKQILPKPPAKPPEKK